MERSQIRSRRRQMGLSQTALASRLGVDQGTISRWERGVEAPRPANFAALTEVLTIPANRTRDARSRAMVEFHLSPAVRLDRHFRLLDYSSRAAHHYARFHGIDLSEWKGRTLRRHIENSGVPELWDCLERSGLREGKLAALHFVLNIRGRGHSTVYETIREGGRFQGFLSYTTEHFDFPENDELSVELVQAVPRDPAKPAEILHRGRFADHYLNPQAAS